MTETKGSALRGWIWIIMIVAIAAAIIFGSPVRPTTHEPPESPAAAQPVDPNAEAERHALAETAAAVLQLKAAARNPDSFVLEQAVRTSPGEVCLTFRAQNGFGGMNRALAIAIGPLVSVEGSKDFETAWRSYCANHPGKEIKEDVQALLDAAGKAVRVD